MEPTIYKPSIYKGAGIYKNGTSGGGGGGTVTMELVNIMPSSNKILVVDENGYIGGEFLGAYYPSTNYYNNFAIMARGADFSALGLGTVTFAPSEPATIGGKQYRTCTIGGQTWLAENLDFEFAGCAINPSGTQTTPAAYYKDATFRENYGLLYNWYAATLLNTNRAELMPGWHIPTKAEFETLCAAVGGLSVAGKVLKSTSGWNNSGNGTDDYNFTSKPAGNYYGSYSSEGNNANFWSSTEYNSNNAYSMYLYYGGDNAALYNYSKSNGFSVRCLKD